MSETLGNTPRLVRLGSVSPTWRVVFARELRDLWIGGKALALILIYSVLLGIYSYLLASNAEVNLLPLKEMVLEMVKASIAVGLFLCLIIGTDSLSGERERATLEGLLLTPTSRRQLVVGKFLAAVSPWPVALAIAVPYWAVLSKGDPVFGQALFWGGLLGSLLAPAFAGMGMLVSLWSNSNKTSMLAGLGLYLVMLLPTELMGGPAKIQRSAEQWSRAELNQWVNPLAATSRFLWKVLVHEEPPSGLWFWHVMPVLFTVLVLGLLFVYASRTFRLDPGMGMAFRSYWNRWRRLAGSLEPRPLPSTRAASSEAGLPQALFIPPPPARRTRGTGRLHHSRPAAPGSASPTWWLVFRKELRDLWIGGKALYLTLAYTVMLALYCYVMARDSVLSLIPPQEMTYELLKAAIEASIFVGLIIGADSLSGERERATLEALLLTPTSRRQIVFGKFLAAASPWPVAMAIAVPYMKVLSQGDAVFGQAVLWGAVLGSVLTPAFTALGMLVGFWCTSNRSSLFVSLCLYLLFLLPTQLPGHAQAGVMGQLVQWLNPMAAPRVFLAKILVNNRTLTDFVSVGPLWSWWLSPVGFALLAFGLLFWYASPGLRLEAGKAGGFLRFRARAAGVLLIASLIPPATALAQDRPPEAPSPAAPEPLQISIDLDATVVKAGTPVLYRTVLTNTGPAPSPPVIMAMNIINLRGSGEPVDPEDWSPQRTQYLEALAPGQAADLSWRVNAILDGDFMVYMVAIPAPGGPEATSHPVTSPGIHLTVTPFTRLNPGGVIPYAIGGPVLLGLVMFLVSRHRRRQIDAGGSE